MTAIGICNTTNTVVYESNTKGFRAYGMKLARGLSDKEWTKFDKHITELEITLLELKDSIDKKWEQ